MSRRRNKNRKRRYSSPVARDGSTQNTSTLAPVDSYKGGSTSSTYTYAKCDHVEVPVRIAPGMTIYATAWHDMGYAHEANRTQPDLGFYLDSAWGRGEVMASASVGQLPFGVSARPKIIYPWPDGSSPASLRTFSTMIEWLSGRLMTGDFIETGCLGAHGRTGTLLAALKIYNVDMTAPEAIAWVRREHCDRAIETHEQERFLYKYANLIKGRPIDEGLPEKPKYSSKGDWDSKWSTSYNATTGTTSYTQRPNEYQRYDSTKGEWVTVPTTTATWVDKTIAEYEGASDFTDDRAQDDDTVALDAWLAEAEDRNERRYRLIEVDEWEWDFLDCPHKEACRTEKECVELQYVE